MWRRRAAFVALLLLTACGHTAAPDRWLPTDAQSQVEGYGGWVSVKYGGKPEREGVSGELIGLTTDRLYVLTNVGMAEVGKSEVESVIVDGYEQNVKQITRGWTAGALSAIPTGFFNILMQPLWAAAGVASLREAWSFARVSYPRMKWEEMARYARFPQGIPPAIDLRLLQPKPLPPPPKPDRASSRER